MIATIVNYYEERICDQVQNILLIREIIAGRYICCDFTFTAAALRVLNCNV